ncbi:uncharacterized protein LOC106088037 [Stomoxys calcitrans]|uniref:Uncharacterized protein n=1 Tax=Stomoxys calcitrans TaxID=35570 RepID=A0A1I8Q9X4_STOCA|nr:uncharacterized protein LOC106088037 [Stomoxys calcitrans]
MNSLCGFRLSTVGIVIGWINLVGSIFSTIILIVAFTRLDDVIKIVQEQIDTDTVDDVGLKTAVIIALSVYLTVNVTNVIASSLLIVGTVKERHLLLTPWLVTTYIFIFYNVLNLVYMIYVAIAKGLPASNVVVPIIGASLSLFIQLIIWNAIYSLFKQIRASRDLQQRLLPTSSGSQYPNYTKMPPTME